MSLKHLLTAFTLTLALAGQAQAGANNHGVITNIQVRQVAQTETSDENNVTGTAIGAAAGALLGRSVSGKHDKTKGTLIGGLVGGVAGNQIQKYNKDEKTTYRDVYTVEVKFDDGHRDTFQYDEEPDFRNGDRVKFKDGRLRRE